MSGVAKWFRDSVLGNATWDAIKYVVLLLLASGGALTYYWKPVGQYLDGCWPRWAAWLLGFVGVLLALAVTRKPGQDDLVFEEPFYYAVDDGTPFCPRCWEDSRKRFHLDEDWRRTRWECPDCHYVKVLDHALPARRP
jgi:ribosomal protein S27AE